MLFINIKMKCHTFVWWVFQRYLCFSFILGWFVCVRWFSFLKYSSMFSHHWKCYLQIDNQYYRKIAFHFVKKAFRLRENVRRIFLLEWNFVCVYQIIKVVEFSQCIPTHTQYGIRYKLYRKPFNLKRFAEINEFGYFEGNSQKWLTTLCRRMWNMNSSVEFAGELVFVWFWIFVLFVYVSSVVSSFDRLFVRSYGVFHFGLGAWMKCARNIITENECIGLNLVPFVYVFALGWNNSTKQSSFLCLLCLRLHTSLVPHW